MGEKVYFTPAGNPINTHGGSGTAYSNYGCRCDECTDANRIRVARRRKAREPAQFDGEHGLESTYSNWKCRCDPCKAAWRKKIARDYAKRVERGLDSSDPRHGTSAAYKGWGCRCEPCKEAGSEYDRSRHANKEGAK